MIHFHILEFDRFEPSTQKVLVTEGYISVGAIDR